jgi:hypothetical protein
MYVVFSYGFEVNNEGKVMVGNGSDEYPTYIALTTSRLLRKKHKFQEKWEGSFLVVERHAKNAYCVSNPNGKKKFKALVNVS